jgi:nucleotide-binding universal stress UspA family protein
MARPLTWPDVAGRYQIEDYAMAYKTILVHLDDEHRVRRLLEAVMPLAGTFEAHVIGLAVLPPVVILPAGDNMGMAVTLDEHRDVYRVTMHALKQAFEAATNGQIAKAEWREKDASLGMVPGIVIEQGAAADLIVASQLAPDWNNSSMMEAPERLALESGRPVLLIPNAGEVRMPPRRVTIAWNGRREAARAVFDALPLLKRADAVNVLSMNSETSATSAERPGDAICATLERHGVKCKATQADASNANMRSEILRLAAAFGSDMLVMGCYGHTRVREFILGGASRDVLSQMSMPVLMSH